MTDSKPRRKATRLPTFDYRSAGPYFVTVCTQHRELRFGTVADGAMHPNPAGQMTAEIWTAIPDEFPAVVLDLLVVMPNHVHGIVWFECRADGAQPSLSDVVGWFKTVTTNHYIRGVRDASWPPYDRHLWQRTFHEHIVRNDADMERIRAYITNNPANWPNDRYRSP